MIADEVRQLVSAQLDAGVDFENFHGITRENVASCLVEPYEILVDPDDLKTAPRLMWVVLHERRVAQEGYVVVFDPSDSSWGVAELTGEAAGTLIVSAASLARALAGM